MSTPRAQECSTTFSSRRRVVAADRAWVWTGTAYVVPILSGSVGLGAHRSTYITPTISLVCGTTPRQEPTRSEFNAALTPITSKRSLAVPLSSISRHRFSSRATRENLPVGYRVPYSHAAPSDRRPFMSSAHSHFGIAFLEVVPAARSAQRGPNSPQPSPSFSPISTIVVATLPTLCDNL
ncbi:hypothetical protein BC629DRAFT_1586424 [Irpex lacteus]|nr:hypothetical protein BC629DRAFT_1586424 [Irpex lacteus]